ncbi:MAG: sulfatase [Acidobacteria bacterium]|nr:MAG: sulfatase [Acidobacteriota bacterium]
MQLFDEPGLRLTRRHFFGRSASGIGMAALAGLLGQGLRAENSPSKKAHGGLPGLPHFAPKAKRVIYLFQSGGPSQMELFDYKPRLTEFQGQDLPDSVRKGQRLTGMSATQSSFPVVPSKFQFAQYGKSGAWVSELMPYTAKAVDQLTFIKSLHTEAINHDPAVTFIQTGAQIAGRPSIGAWLAYGIGCETEDLPAFVVMISPGKGTGGQPLYDRLWGSGFLPSRYQGVKFRSVGDPVLYLSNPSGFNSVDRRRFLNALDKLNQMNADSFGDPEIATRIAQYEMAFRMQTSVPELTDLSKESAHTFELYGEDAKTPGTFAANCLLARRLAERGVRFIQLFHRDWDHHGNLPKDLPKRCKEVDQASAALVQDLKERGMLDETLVIWGGEFGRTVYCQGRLTPTDYGRDHHPRCFTSWMAGGGIKPGILLGETDDYCYNITKDPVDVYDLQATILHCLGIDHTRLTYQFQGRHFRLTDIAGKVVKSVLA